MRWLLVVAIAVGSAGVSAQNDKQEAQTFFRSGERAFQAGQYASAAQAFEEAYRRFESPAIAFSAAQAYRLQYFVDKKPRNLKRAVELYRSYLQVVDSGGRRADAAANLAELEPILQRLEAEAEIDMAAPTARITKLLITSEVEGARVRVNGEAARTMPWAKEVSPGKYRIQVDKAGYFPFDETREVFEGQFRVVEVELRPRSAKLSVATESGAVVKIDGRTVDGVAEVRAGKHWVTVSKRGRKALAREVTLKRGQVMNLEADLESTPQRRLSYVVMGTGAAALIAGTGLMVAAKRSDNEASDLLDIRDDRGLTLAEHARYLELRDQRDSRLRNSYIFLGVGAAISGAGVLMYVLDTPPAPERPEGSPAVAPVIGEDSVGAVFTGRF